MKTLLPINLKNQYLWVVMKVVKNKRPYYAQWWFFIGLLTLGWITPITKHWELYLFGERATAYPIKVMSQYNYFTYKFVYTVNGVHYTVDHELDIGETPDPEGITIIYNTNDPSTNLSFQLKEMYTNENLFFPVGFQIAFGVFFLSIRFKDL